MGIDGHGLEGFPDITPNISCSKKASKMVKSWATSSVTTKNCLLLLLLLLFLLLLLLLLLLNFSSSKYTHTRTHHQYPRSPAHQVPSTSVRVPQHTSTPSPHLLHLPICPVPLFGSAPATLNGAFNRMISVVTCQILIVPQDRAAVVFR